MSKLPVRALLMALAAALLFGAATPASKVLLSALSPFQIAGLLGLGSAIASLPFVLSRGRMPIAPWQLDRTNRNRLLISLGFGGTLGPVLLLLGLQLASAGSVSMWLNLELGLTVAVAALFFKEHVGRRGWFAIAIAALGAGLLTIGEGLAGVEAGALVALACLCWALDNNATATIDGISPAETVFWKGLVSGCVNSSIALLLVGSLPALSVAFPGLIIGAFCFGTSIMLYISAAQILGAARTQTMFASAPFWGLLLSAVLLGEGLTVMQLVAAALLAVSIYMLFKLKHTHTHRHDPATHTHVHSHDDGHHGHRHDATTNGDRHAHVHSHAAEEHSHEHYPDLHHRHDH